MKTVNRALLALGMGSVVLLGPKAAMTGGTRTYTAGNFFLQIDGSSQFVKSVEGGNASAPETTRGARKDGYADKQNGPVRYSDAVLMLPMNQPKSMWDWVNNFSSPAARTPKEVTILGLDYTLAEKSRRQLLGTKISKIDLPTCDGSSKEPAYLALTLTPGAVRESTGSGAKSAAPGTAEHMWLPSNFALAIDGIDTTHVSKIDKIVIKRGDSGPPEYSDFEITVAETDSTSWKQWADAAQAGKGAEKNGRIDFFDSARKTFLRVNLEGLGIVGLVPDKAEANSDTIRRVTAQMYVEKITFALQ
jgi:hypothetical protein